MVLPIGFSAGRILADSGPAIPDLTGTGHYVYSRNGAVESIEDVYFRSSTIFVASRSGNQTITVSSYSTTTGLMNWSKDYSLNSTGTGVSTTSYQFTGGSVAFIRNAHSGTYGYLTAEIYPNSSTNDTFVLVFNKSTGAHESSGIFHNNSGIPLNDFEPRQSVIVSHYPSPRIIIAMNYDGAFLQWRGGTNWDYMQAVGNNGSERPLGTSGSYLFYAYWYSGNLYLVRRSYSSNDTPRRREIDFNFTNSSGGVLGGFVSGTNVVVFGYGATQGGPYHGWIYSDNTSFNASNNPVVWDETSSTIYNARIAHDNNECIMAWDSGSTMDVIQTNLNPRVSGHVQKHVTISGNSGAGPYRGYVENNNEYMSNDLLLVRTQPNYPGGIMQLNKDDFNAFSGTPTTVGSAANYTVTDNSSSISTNFYNKTATRQNAANFTTNRQFTTSATGNAATNVVTTADTSDTMLLEYAN